MPKANVTYSPEIRKSEQGQRLYQCWKKVRKKPHDPAWDSYPAFYLWAIKAGYFLGARLHAINHDLPHGPTNCEWRGAVTRERPATPEQLQMAAKWNETVNRIRAHYGMEPLQTEAEHGSK